MSANLEMLWSKVKDLKHDAQRFTDNKAIHGLINERHFVITHVKVL